MRVTFDTNTLDPVTRPELAGSLRAQCRAIYQSLSSKRLEGFFCETVLTVEGGEGNTRAETVARVKRALDVGMHILSAPRIGSVAIDDPNGDLYARDADEEALSMRLERYGSIATAIEARGLGFVHVSKVAGPASLNRARAPGDSGKVARAVAEWADGDSVAAHYGYANHLFCTEDRARKAGRNSVMHPAQRSWLRRVYGVNFVGIAELAALLSPYDSG